MASKHSIAKRRQSIGQMLEDAQPVRLIAELWHITPETIAKDWHEVEEEYRRTQGYDEKIRPHTVYRLALCGKLAMLSKLGYSQTTIARMLKLSQSQVSRLKKWAESEGTYGNTCIRIRVNEKVETVDGQREVEPGDYFVWPMGDANCWLAKEGAKSYMVRLSDLRGRHSVISAYARDYKTKD